MQAVQGGSSKESSVGESGEQEAGGLAGAGSFVGEQPRGPHPQHARRARPGQQEGRKPTAGSMLPAFSPPLPRVLHPQAPMWPPCTPACPTGCHALPLCTGSLLGTASHPALLTVPHSPCPTAG